MLNKRNDTNSEDNARLRLILAVACLLLCVLLMGGITFARYFGDWNGSLETDVAQWKIKVNGVSLADTASASKITIDDCFYVVDNGVATKNPSIIRPGQSGYFDVEIDPDGTQTSFTYKMTLDARYFPDGMRVAEYSVDGGENKTIPADSCVTGDVFLSTASDGTVFTSANKLTVRFFWEWDENADFNEDADYWFSVNVSVEQYLGDAASTNEEGGEE